MELECIFADFDLDGNKDIFVANGLKWDVMDKDFNRLGITHDKMEQISKEAMKAASDSAKLKVILGPWPKPSILVILFAK